VLAWRADEVAAQLEMSLPAVNSALQRARATMKTLQETAAISAPTSTPDTQTYALLARYVHAWETADVEGLVALLCEGAVLTMPPVPAWFGGRAAIQAFLSMHLFQGEAAGRYRLVPTHANGCPAFAVYARNANGVYLPAALQVLRVTVDGIAALHDFLAVDDRLFARFDLPPTLER
jgi:RNA polymerase sigma-70 factor (ECF subfamily)